MQRRGVLLVVVVALFVAGYLWLGAARTSQPLVPQLPLGEDPVSSPILGGALPGQRHEEPQPNIGNTPLLHGNAVVTTEAGDRLGGLNGELVFRIAGELTESTHRAKVIGGTWTTDLVGVDAIDVLSLALEDRSVVLVSSTISVSPDGECDVEGRWSKSALLRVVDAKTRADLHDVSVYRTVVVGTNPSDTGFDKLKKVTPAPTDSPIVLPYAEGAMDYLVTATGYERKWIAIDHDSGGSRLLSLGRSFDLHVVANEIPVPQTPRLVLYKAVSNQDGSSMSGQASRVLVRTVRLAGTPPSAPPFPSGARWSLGTTLAGLSPGRYVLQLEDDEDVLCSDARVIDSAERPSMEVGLTYSRVADNGLSSSLLEGVILLPSGTVETELSLSLWCQEPETTAARGVVSMNLGNADKIYSDVGQAFHWSAGNRLNGRWIACVGSFQYLAEFSVPPGPRHYQELVVPTLSTVTVRVLDNKTGKPLSLDSLAWVPTAAVGLRYARAVDVAPISDNRRLEFRCAPGPISLLCRLRGGGRAQGVVNIVAGENAVDLQVGSSTGSVVVTLTDGPAIVPVSIETWSRAQIRTPEGVQQVVSCTSRTKGVSGAGTSARYTGLAPGRYVLTFPLVDGFEALAPTTFRIESADQDTHLEVPLTRSTR